MKQLLIFSLLLLCSGCQRYRVWSRNMLPQGACCDHLRAVVADHLRSVRMYDQFSTLVVCDLLWISPEVSAEFVRTRADRKQFTCEQYAAVSEVVDEHAQPWITFYIFFPTIALERGSLASPHTQWSFSLRIDGSDYQPYDIREHQLEAEYYAVIHPNCMRARVVYRIRFPAYDAQGDHIVNRARTKIMQLIVAHPRCKAAACWQFDARGMLIVPVLKRRGALAYDL